MHIVFIRIGDFQWRRGQRQVWAGRPGQCRKALHDNHGGGTVRWVARSDTYIKRHELFPSSRFIYMLTYLPIQAPSSLCWVIAVLWSLLVHTIMKTMWRQQVRWAMPLAHAAWPRKPPPYLPPSRSPLAAVCLSGVMKKGWISWRYVPSLGFIPRLILFGLCGKFCRESVSFCAGDDHGTFRHSVWEWLFWIWCVFSSWLSNVPSPDKPWDHRKPHHQV